jgi:tetratricopeptide (TPR) repeat protein
MISPEQSKIIRECWQQAHAFLGKKEFRKAIEQYTRAIEVVPIAEGFERRGVCYNYINARQEALHDFQICLANNFNVNENLFHCGLAYRGMDQREMALECFNKLVELNPGEARYLYERGRTHAQLHHYKEALVDLEQVEKMNPETALPGYSGLVSQFKEICQDELKKGNIAERLEQAEEFFRMAQKEFDSNDVKSAANNYLKAIECNPFHMEAFRKLGASLFRSGRNKSAINYLNWVININYGDFFGRVNRSAAYYNLEEYQKALEDAHMAVQIRPDDAGGYSCRANAYGDLGEPALAIADYNRAIELDPNDGYTYYNRALELKWAGEYANAIADLNKALELIKPTSQLFFERGRCFWFQKDYEAAVRDYSKAIELNPKNQQAFRERGRTLFGLRQNQEALADYDQAITLTPSDHEALWLRGLVYQTLKRPGESLPDFKKAIELDPEKPHYRKSLGEAEESLREKTGGKSRN